jgi:hypothetical protein
MWKKAQAARGDKCGLKAEVPCSTAIAETKISYSDLSDNKRSGSVILLLMRYPLPEQLPALLRTLLAPAVSKCAQCGADLVAPDWSEHLSEHRVRNVWSCEFCGYQFEGTVYLPSKR